MSDEHEEQFRIITFSDMHCGDPRFDEDLMNSAISEINEARPDLVVVAGDLTAAGYRNEFIQAKEYLARLDCPRLVVIAGNHDCRNVSYLHFEQLIGARHNTATYDFNVCCGTKPQNQVRIVASDSNKPDLNDGEVGRGHYAQIKENFSDPDEFKVFVVHHYLIGVPGTGRERNIILDAGDVLSILRETEVDLVLCGHKHVPNAWQFGKTLILNSGTVSTYRTRGFFSPSYNLIDITPRRVDLSIITPGRPEPVRARFPRPKAFSELS